MGNESTAIKATGKGSAHSIVGTFRAPKEVNKRLAYAASEYNLVSPATSVGSLPEGCGVALAMIHVDPSKDSSDTYQVAAGRGLSKTILQQIGAGLGVSWDPQRSGRLDDCSDPYYVRWRAVGAYRAFDGQPQILVAEKELDLRDGSPTCVGLHAQARGGDRGNADKQIREMRMHIQSHAETKAQLRAIRALGIKTSYSPKELARPFVCARVMFTGQTSDPVLKREFAMLTANAFVRGRDALFGDSPAALPVPAAAPPPQLAATLPPAVGTVLDEEEGVGFEPHPPPIADTTAETVARETEAGDQPSGFELPYGRSKGTPIEEAADDDLEYFVSRLSEKLEAEPDGRWAEKDTALRDAMVDEQTRRGGAH